MRYFFLALGWKVPRVLPEIKSKKCRCPFFSWRPKHFFLSKYLNSRNFPTIIHSIADVQLFLIRCSMSGMLEHKLRCGLTTPKRKLACFVIMVRHIPFTHYSLCTVFLWFSFPNKFHAANKYWSGLLRDYYGPRAAIYFKYLILSMEKKEPFALEEWRREWISLTNNWQSDWKVFPTTATGDALNISRTLYKKYLHDADLIQPEGIIRLRNLKNTPW